MKISSSKIIINNLLFNNIEFIFGYPGGAVLHIYDAIFNSNIKHILVRHEQAAVHMADGYSRSSKKVGIVIVTSGPGYTNCITGIATAKIDNSSLIIICGQVNKNLISQNSFQEINNLGISLSIVDYFFSINCHYNISYIINNIFKILKNGPIIIDFPKNLTSSIKKSRFKFPINKNKFFLSKININKILEIKKILKKSKRPLIIFGGGIKKKNFLKKIINLIENIKIPFVSTLMGLGGFNYRNPYYLGWLGMHGNLLSNIITHYSDLLICLCTRLDDRITNNNKLFSPYSNIIQVDINEDSISKTIFSNYYFINDINFFFNIFFILKIKKKWWKNIIFFKKIFKINYINDFFYCKPQQIIEILFYLTNGKFFLTTDVGQHQMFAAQYYFYNYNKFITSGGLGTMGFGFPCSIGIKFSNKNSKILLITGEGSYQMMMQELSTCKQYNINIIIFNLNNQSLGMVKQWQELNYSNRYSNSYVFSLPNFKKLINSYNFYSFNFYKLKNFYYFCISLLKKDIFCFINIYINLKENVFPIQLFNKSMNEVILFYSKKKHDKKFNILFL